MDLILLIDNLYESSTNHELSQEDSKNKWLNLHSLLQNILNSQTKHTHLTNSSENRKLSEKLLKDSNIFLMCSSQEQKEYLLFLQMQLNQRGLKLKADLTEQQMIESGLAYAIVLYLEEEFNEKISKSSHPQKSQKQSNNQAVQPQYRSIHKVLNYDYFAENNISENVQRYEEVTMSDTNPNTNQKNRNTDEETNSLLPYLFPNQFENEGQNSDSRSPLTIKINHTSNINSNNNTQLISQNLGNLTQNNNYTSQNISYVSQNLFSTSNILSNNKSIRKDSSRINGDSDNSCFLREDFIMNMCILFNRFFDAFEKTQGQSTLGFSPCLSHYFLNLVSQKKQQEVAMGQESNLKSKMKQDQMMHNISPIQSCFTPQKIISTPDAIKNIEDKNYYINPNQEDTKEKPYTSSFISSNVQAFNPLDNLFERKQKNKNFIGRHSIDHTGDKIVDSPRQYKNHNKNNEKYESCIQGGNIFFEDSQVVINKLDMERRTYKQYSQEQSAQIQELNTLYTDLKNKYESLIQQSQMQNRSRTEKQECLDKSEVIQSTPLFQSNEAFLKTSECNPLIIQAKSKNIFIENDSDLNRRQIHNDLLNQSFLFQSHNQIIEESDTPSQESLPNATPLFNYVDISDILNNKIKSSFLSNPLNLSNKKVPINKKDAILQAISSLIIAWIIYLIIVY